MIELIEWVDRMDDCLVDWIPFPSIMHRALEGAFGLFLLCLLLRFDTTFPLRSHLSHLSLRYEVGIDSIS